MKNKLFILISTIDNRVLNIKNIIGTYDKHIIYIISHQITKVLEKEVKHYVDDLIKRTDVQYSLLKGKGVARNRNNTLRFIEPHTIFLILDDDIILCENTFEKVIQSFDENPSADFISFKILDLEGNDYKYYPKEKQKHTLRTLTGIGTTEMALRSNSVLRNNVKFDERFGPGAKKYPLGEDFIFSMDLYHLKTNMLFLPIPIVKHSLGSTGGRLDQKIIFARGAMFARVFGWKAFLVNIFFAIKKYTTYCKNLSFFSYLILLTKGSMDYFNFFKKKVS